jgi:hypothetical protein
LLDSGSSSSIILAKFVNKLHLKDEVKTQWLMKGGVFNTTKQCKTSFILHEFYENRLIEWNLHVDFTSLPQCYDLIIGHDFMSELGIIFNFNDQMMTWDESTIKMRDYEMFSDILSPINDFYLHKEILESQVLNEASSLLKKILDKKYKPAKQSQQNCLKMRI